MSSGDPVLGVRERTLLALDELILGEQGREPLCRSALLLLMREGGPAAGGLQLDFNGQPSAMQCVVDPRTGEPQLLECGDPSQLRACCTTALAGSNGASTSCELCASFRTGHALRVPLAYGGRRWGSLAVAWAQPPPELRAQQVWLSGFAKRLAHALSSLASRMGEADAEQRFRRLFDSSIDAIIVADGRGQYKDANEAASRLLGYSRAELRGMNVADLQVPSDEPAADEQYRAFTRAGQDTGLFSFVNQLGERRTAEYSAFAVGDDEYVSILRDVTERTQLQERMRQVERAESVGRLASGIAHDFNNLLMVIRSFNGFVREVTGPDDPRQADLTGVEEAAARATELTRQLLAFARRERIAPRNVDLNRLLGELLRVLRPALGERIEIVATLTERIWPVFIDASKFEQVVMNLVLNARDAMPEGGTLRIETRNVAAGEGQVEECVLLRVSDTGVGMNPEVRARALEPFFTTKPPGKGTGLGLSTAYGLVTQAGGEIVLDSAPNEGTRVDVCLPRSQRAQAVDEAAEQAAADPGVALDRTGTVLVVEDEPRVREAATRMLEHNGFRVLVAANGSEALASFRDSGQRIDALLCDMVMPGMGGLETANALREARPELSVLLMTGYSEDQLEEPRGWSVLHKPFSEPQLLHALQVVLGRDSRP